jgi:hypothetical protein
MIINILLPIAVILTYLGCYIGMGEALRLLTKLVVTPDICKRLNKPFAQVGFVVLWPLILVGILAAFIMFCLFVAAKTIVTLAGKV